MGTVWFEKSFLLYIFYLVWMMHAVHSGFKLQNPPEIDSVIVVCLICDFSFHEPFSSKFDDKLLSLTFKNVSNCCRYKNDFLCLVLLCDQNSFGWSKMVLVWPNWFGLDHNDLVTTKMNWSGPNVVYFGRKSQFGPDHYGQVQINLVRRKQF